MTIQGMLETLKSCSCFQSYISKKPICKTTDLTTRANIKPTFFFKSFIFLFFSVLISVFSIISLCYIVDSALGKTFLISMFPMLLVTLSWMIPVWVFFDKRNWMLITTVGMVPLRIVFVLCFVYLIITYFPMVNMATLGIGMMGHWTLFFIPEIYMMHNLSKAT